MHVADEALSMDRCRAKDIRDGSTCLQLECTFWCILRRSSALSIGMTRVAPKWPGIDGNSSVLFLRSLRVHRNDDRQTKCEMRAHACNATSSLWYLVADGLNESVLFVSYCILLSVLDTQDDQCQWPVNYCCSFFFQKRDLPTTKKANAMWETISKPSTYLDAIYAPPFLWTIMERKTNRLEASSRITLAMKALARRRRSTWWQTAIRQDATTVSLSFDLFHSNSSFKIYTRSMKFFETSLVHFLEIRHTLRCVVVVKARRGEPSLSLFWQRKLAQWTINQHENTNSHSNSQHNFFILAIFMIWWEICKTVRPNDVEVSSHFHLKLDILFRSHSGIKKF